jgi:N-acetylglucosamine-6-sulfatase
VEPPSIADGPAVVSATGRPAGARRLLVAAWIVVVALSIALTIDAVRGQQPQPGSPNVVIIVTDDQRWDTLADMPIVRSQLVDKGVRYQQDVVSNSLCCPSRSTILTGDYSHTTGVWTNEEKAFGGYPTFHSSGLEDHTLAAWLSDAGYRTGLFGKYLNEYPGGAVPYGWDSWDAFAGDAHFYNYRMFSNEDGGTITHYGEAPRAYSTRVIGSAAESFIRATPDDEPLFAYVATYGPHGPSKPDPIDRGALEGQPLPTPPNFNEKDVSDKPGYIQALSRLSPDKQHRLQRLYHRQGACLIGIDRMVGRLLDALQETGRLDNTIILYTSDNGLSNGEHRWIYKLTPYEESVRVPLVIRWDGHIPAHTTSGALSSNIDFAPTIAAAAGAAHPSTDGSPLLGGHFHRNAQLLEHLAYRRRKPDPPSYCGLRSRRWTYVRYDTGEEELYDRRQDPFELRNIAYAPDMAGRVARYRAKASRDCMPRPPGWTDSFQGQTPLGG